MDFDSLTNIGNTSPSIQSTMYLQGPLYRAAQTKHIVENLRGRHFEVRVSIGHYGEARELYVLLEDTVLVSQAILVSTEGCGLCVAQEGAVPISQRDLCVDLMRATFTSISLIGLTIFDKADRRNRFDLEVLVSMNRDQDMESGMPS